MSERITKDRFRCVVTSVSERGDVGLFIMAIGVSVSVTADQPILSALGAMVAQTVRITMQDGDVTDVELDDGKEFG